jgi:hypothetical protein
MKKILQRIKDSYFKSLRGEESFLRYCCWGFVVCAANVIFVALIHYLLTSFPEGNSIVKHTSSFVAPFGMLFAIFYPLIFLFLLVSKYANRSLSRLIGLSAVCAFFILSHLIYLKRVIASSVAPIMISPVWFFGLILVILTIKKTLSSLSTKTHK